MGRLVLGSDAYKRTFESAGYRPDGERASLLIHADNRRHARSIAKKAGFEIYNAHEVKL